MPSPTQMRRGDEEMFSIACGAHEGALCVEGSSAAGSGRIGRPDATRGHTRARAPRHRRRSRQGAQEPRSIERNISMTIKNLVDVGAIPRLHVTHDE